MNNKLKLSGYVLHELILPYLDKLDDTSLMVIGYHALNKICEHNGYEKDEDGNVIHPCSPYCPIGKGKIGCSGLEDLKEKTVARLHDILEDENEIS